LSDQISFPGTTAQQVDGIPVPEQLSITIDTVLNSIPEAVIAVDANGRITFTNRLAAGYFGKKRLDVDPQEWPEHFGFYLEDRQTHFPSQGMPLVRALAGEKVESEEMIFFPEEGEDGIWISMSAQPVQSPGRITDGAVVTFRDISYRRQVELSREKHARRTEILHSLSQSISELGSDLSQILSTVVAQTASNLGDACVVTRYLPHEREIRVAASYHPNAAGRALLNSILAATNDDLMQGIIGGVITSGEPLLIPVIRQEQAESITLPQYVEYVRNVGITSMLVVPIKGRSGVLGTIGLTRDRGGRPYTGEDQSLLVDIALQTALAVEHYLLVESLRKEISGRRTVERALQDTEERFRSIFESTTLGIKVLDLDGNIVQINPAFGGIVGYPNDELVGTHFSRYIHPGDVDRSVHLFGDLKRNRVKDFLLEHRLIHKGGAIVWVNATFTGIKDSRNPDEMIGVVSIAEDISEKKRVQMEMAEMKLQLQNNVEMERLRLAQELHDGPMQELYSAIYQLDGSKDLIAAGQLDVIDSVKQDLQKLIRDLRSIAVELRPPTIAIFGLEKAILSHAESFREKYPNIDLHLNLDQDLEILPENVRIALFRIYQQAMTNIIRHAEASRVDIRFSFDTEVARLEVADNGKGFIVPENWISLIRQGHFGLAGAAERIESLGGTLKLISRPGGGTSVRLVVPYKETSELRSPDKLEGAAYE
jgi:PAS domain S-box-containing protein